MPVKDQPADRSGALRLIFEYDGDEVRLVHQQPVDVLVTGFDAAPELRAGRFAEVRDAEDRALARVVVRGDMASQEVFPENPEDPITRIEVEHPVGAFTVVVPVSAAARNVALLDVAITAPPPPTPDGRMAYTAPAKPQENVLGIFALDAGTQQP